MPIKTLIFTGDAPKRIDIFLAESFADFSRSYFKALIRQGLVKVDSKETLSSAKLKKGQEVSVDFIVPLSAITPEKVDFRVVYEDSDILVVDKPSGVVVHPACGHRSGTLVNGIAGYLGGDACALPRVGLVHRLDKETSGLLIAAKNEKSFKSLSKQFASRSVKKTYVALVNGAVREDRGIIDKPIGRSKADRKKMAVAADGRASETYFNVLRRYSSYTLLEVMPKTGRTHQIRVHLASIGHSVAGDNQYGPKNCAAGRLLLHAHKLEVTHPSESRRVNFKADLPVDFKRGFINLQLGGIILSHIK